MSLRTPTSGDPWSRRERAFALAIFLALLAVFASARIVFVSDSLFTAWLGERIVRQQALDLEPALQPGALVAQDEPVIGVWHAVERDGRHY